MQYLRHAVGGSSAPRTTTYNTPKGITSSFGRKLKTTNEASASGHELVKDQNRDSSGFMRLQDGAASESTDPERSASNRGTIFPISEDEERATSTDELEGKFYSERTRRK